MLPNCDNSAAHVRIELSDNGRHRPSEPGFPISIRIEGQEAQFTPSAPKIATL
jgi:hypothetical protein